MNIGKAIVKLRKAKKLSQGDLAKICKISQTSLSQIEKGYKKPRTTTLKKISKALDIPETIIHFSGLEISDIPKSKKYLFKELYPVVEKLIEQLVA